MSFPMKEASGGFCEHCGGVVGEDGMAEDLDTGVDEEAAEGEGDTTPQSQIVDKMRDDSGFAAALRRRGSR